MALSTYLYANEGRGDGKTLVNGIKHMLYTIDPAVTATTALRKASAMTALEAASGVTYNEVDYFATEQLIGAAAGGLLPALDDLVYFPESGAKVESIA